MPFSLAWAQEHVLVYKSTELHLNLSYDVVLRYFELIEDESFDTLAKSMIAFEMFVENAEEIEDISDRADCLEMILNDYLEFNVEDANGEDSSGEQLYDFTKDAGYIYASFLFDYQLDLVEMRGKLHWLEFLELFKNLSSKSKMGEAIYYRSVKVPSVKEVGQKERKRILDMKKYYRLHKETPQEQRMQHNIADLFGYLKAKSEK